MKNPFHPEPGYPKLRKPLISVEFQREVDVATGRGDTRMFVKMYFEARNSGLLAALPDDLWKMLCCLATYIDENGNCHPSQARIGQDLGIRRRRVNERIKRLLAFRFQGQPVISMTKQRKSTQNGIRWANNSYQLLPLAGFGIFDDASRDLSEFAEKTRPGPYVRKSGHGPMSAQPVSGLPDTNQNQIVNETTSNVGSTKASVGPEGREGATSPVSPGLTGPRDPRVGLIRMRLEDTGSSDLNIRRIVARMPAQEIDHAIYQAWGRYRDGHTLNPARYFVGIMKNRAAELGIDLGLGPRLPAEARPGPTADV